MEAMTLNFDKPAIMLVRTSFEAELISRRFNALFVDLSTNKSTMKVDIAKMTIGAKKPFIVAKLEHFKYVLTILNLSGIDWSVYRVFYDKANLDSKSTFCKNKVSVMFTLFNDVVALTPQDTHSLYNRFEVELAFDCKSGTIYDKDAKHKREVEVQAMFDTRRYPKMQHFVPLKKTSRINAKGTTETIYRVE